MRTITIKSLAIDGFRGQSQTIAFGHDTVISGDNGCGKTTVLDAFLWLLTGYDSADRLNYNLFDNKVVFSHDNPGSVTVTGVFGVGEVDLKLSKSVKQVWRRNRGSVEYSRDADAFVYCVDDVEITATEYRKTIEQVFAQMDMLKLMLNIRHWESMDWRDLRGLLIQLAGEVSQEDFTNDYSEVAETVADKGVDGATKIFAKAIKEQEITLSQVAASIAATRGILPNVSEIELAEGKIAALQAEREEIVTQQGALKVSDDARIAKRKLEEEAIGRMEVECLKAKSAYEIAQGNMVRALKSAIADAEHTNAQNKRDRVNLRSKIAELKTEIEVASTKREQHLMELDVLKRRQFDGYCPNCGAAYTGKIRAEKLSQFQTDKDGAIAEKIAMGKAVTARRQVLEQQLAEAEEALRGLADVDVDELQSQYRELRDNFVPWEQSEQSRRMNAELERLRNSRTELIESPEMTALLTRKGTIDVEIIELHKVAALRDAYEKGRERISVLTADKKAAEQSLATNERRKLLVEEYSKEYMEVIRRKVNDRLRGVSVEVSRTLKNGETQSCCIFNMNGVVNTWNGASRIIIGIELSRAFQAYCGLILPIFIDECGEITSGNIPAVDGQIIRMYVDDSFSTLNVETTLCETNL